MSESRFDAMQKELRRPHNFNAMRKNIILLMKQRGVIGDAKDVVSDIMHKGKPMQLFFFRVASDKNGFGEDIEIVVRSDSLGKHRALDTHPAVGLDSESYHEDADDGGPIRRVFHRERTFSLRDIGKFLDEEIEKKSKTFRKVG